MTTFRERAAHSVVHMFSLHFHIIILLFPVLVQTARFGFRLIQFLVIVNLLHSFILDTVYQLLIFLLFLFERVPLLLGVGESLHNLIVAVSGPSIQLFYRLADV